MEPAGLYVSALTLLVLILLATEKVSLDALGIGLLLALIAPGVLELDQALLGFSNHAVITIAGLYIVGEGLTRTGAVEFLAHFVLKASGGRERRLVLLVGLVSGAISAFLNNTAVVVVFIPILINLARDTGIPASRMLMPLAYSSLLGGMCTLVGTSTNLLVSGAAEAEGLEGIGMFELSPIGVPLALLGILFMAAAGRWLLPNRRSLTSEVAASNKRAYVTEIVIGPHSPLIGQTYGEAFGQDGPAVMYVIRDEETIASPPPEFVINVGDEAVLEGNVGELTGMQTKLGLKLVGGLNFDPSSMTVFELAVAPHSAVLGRRLADIHFHRDYGSVVIAVLRRDREIRQRASRMLLKPGDLLLVCGDERSKARVSESTDFFLITGAHKQVVLRQHARRALAVAAGVVSLFTLASVFRVKAVPPSMAALAGAMAMVVTGCVSTRRAYRSIDWPILLFVIGSLALGEAMRETGAASTYAHAIVGAMDGFGTTIIIASLVLLATVFNAFISPSAVAVLATPIAIQMARELGLDPRPFILAVAFGGSLAFTTPMGHQVNLMVYAPGGYRFSDFLRLGLPLTLICWILVSLGIVWLYEL